MRQVPDPESNQCQTSVLRGSRPPVFRQWRLRRSQPRLLPRHGTREDHLRRSGTWTEIVESVRLPHRRRTTDSPKPQAGRSARAAPARPQQAPSGRRPGLSGVRRIVQGSNGVPNKYSKLEGPIPKTFMKTRCSLFGEHPTDRKKEERGVFTELADQNR